MNLHCYCKRYEFGFNVIVSIEQIDSTGFLRIDVYEKSRVNVWRFFRVIKTRTYVIMRTSPNKFCIHVRRFLHATVVRSSTYGQYAAYGSFVVPVRCERTVDGARRAKRARQYRRVRYAYRLPDKRRRCIIVCQAEKCK